MVSDSAEQVHFGMVELGGFTPVRSLDANDRRHMFELERANLVARRVMGTDRYLATVRQQNQGTARGEDTDMNPDELPKVSQWKGTRLWSQRAISCRSPTRSGQN